MTLRVAIYARYSSDRQSDRSIEDQVRICEARIAQEGWQAVGTYTDAAISGSSTARPGYQSLMRDMREGRFDVVLSEALDRISRDQEDIAGFYKQAQFANVVTITLSEGEISELHIGLKGTMNALFLKDLASKTKRGLEGRVRQGRSGGGNAYGYEVIREFGPNGSIDRGRRKIIPAQAQIVRRIFLEFSDGMSPNQIARGLNNDNIPGPTGTLWRDTTIRGHIKRGTGILNNELYIGRLIWNRMSYLKNPTTGKKVSRRNSTEKSITSDVPHLRILDDTLWSNAKARQKTIWKSANEAIVADVTPPYWTQKRAPNILTERAFCSHCGGPIIAVGKDYLACSNARKLKTCAQNKSIRRPYLEGVVIDMLRQQLMQPLPLKDFIEAYNSGIAAQQSKASDDHVQQGKRLKEVELKLSGLYDAIADGLRGSGLQQKLDALEAEKLDITLSLKTPKSATVSLHPALAELYQQKLRNLAEVLQNPKMRDQAIIHIRELIDRVDVRNHQNNWDIALKGELSGLIALAQNDKNPPKSGVCQSTVNSSVKVVAGTHNRRCLTTINC